jgi:alcohol dehydrogenase class IV
LTLAGSIVTHPLAHPISARLDARHGEAVAAIEPATLAVLAPQLATTPHVVRVATWLDVRSVRDPDAAVQGVISRLVRFCTKLRVRRSLADLGVDAPGLAVLVRDARVSGSRGLANSPGGEPSPDLLFRILDVARACGPTTPVKQLRAAAAEAAARDAVVSES